MNIPRILVAGTGSGVGKTSVTLGLVTLLRRRGLKVQTFKVGPDYLDTGYLSIASGRTCYNLDGWMMGKDYIERLFCRAAQDADIAIIEGAMGLFDGASAVTDESSSAEIARWLHAPILLVANAHGMGRSIAATVHGYVHFASDIAFAGIVANRCGSERHVDLVRDALHSSSLPPLVASILRDELPAIPSRHLGLVSADEKNLTADFLNRLADALSRSFLLESVLESAQKTLPIRKQIFHKNPRLQTQCRLGVAKDRAFHFYYPDNLETLEREGCEIVYFSPLDDSALPENLDGIYIGGGYPEEFAEQLSNNTSLIADLKSFATSGKGIYAECGGLMYLSQGIKRLDGKAFSQVGILPGWTTMKKKRVALGYVEVTLKTDAHWGKAGDVLRGHEYHYSEFEFHNESNWKTVYSLKLRRTGETFYEGYCKQNVLASYAHLHFASNPHAIRHFINHIKNHVVEEAEV